jgi:type IV pilus assembly protein PilN
MVRINLLPWRAERRKQRERVFFMQLGAAFLAALMVVIGGDLWMDVRLRDQTLRNAYLHEQVTQLDKSIVKIQDLEKMRQRLLRRKQIIEQLQASRSQMVHLFDELVKTIPDSIQLTALKQTGDTMILDGVAQSNASVAEYMRRLEHSPWVGRVDLRKTENTRNGARLSYIFGLSVVLRHPGLDIVRSPQHRGSALLPRRNTVHQGGAHS